MTGLLHAGMLAAWAAWAAAVLVLGVYVCTEISDPDVVPVPARKPEPVWRSGLPPAAVAALGRDFPDNYWPPFTPWPLAARALATKDNH